MWIQAPGHNWKHFFVLFFLQSGDEVMKGHKGWAGEKKKNKLNIMWKYFLKIVPQQAITTLPHMDQTSDCKSWRTFGLQTLMCWRGKQNKTKHMFIGENLWSLRVWSSAAMQELTQLDETCRGEEVPDDVSTHQCGRSERRGACVTVSVVDDVTWWNQLLFWQPADLANFLSDLLSARKSVCLLERPD